MDHAGEGSGISALLYAIGFSKIWPSLKEWQPVAFYAGLARLCIFITGPFVATRSRSGFGT